MWRATAGAVGVLFVPACGLSPAGERPPLASDAAAPPIDAPGGPMDGSLGPLDGSGDEQPADASDEANAEASGAQDATSEVSGEASAGDGSSSDAGPVSDGYSLSFDGSKTYVDCGVVPIPTDFTIEAWVHPTSFNGETYVLAEDERNYGQGQFRLGFIGGGQLFFYMTDASGQDYGLYTGQYNVLSSNTVPSNAWSDVAVTKSGGLFTLFVGGTPVAAFQSSMPFSFGSGMQLPLRIGSRVAQSGGGADGGSRDSSTTCASGKVSRTEAQIQAAMHAEVPSTAPAWSDLQDYWPFDEVSGTMTADRSGGHPGTLVAGPSWVETVPF